MDYVPYGFAFLLIMFASYVGNQYRQTIIESESNQEYDMVKKYLLNDSPLYGNNKPKLWIHSTFAMNARQWKNFMSRNSTDLNQPYLSLTMQSIVQHCGDDFHICLIDDDSFEALLPSWISLLSFPEPKRSRMRDIGMVRLLQQYGGIIVPNSFLCLKSLKDMYLRGIADNRVFVTEKINRSTVPGVFTPDIHMMGSKKNNAELDRLLEVLTTLQPGDHFSQESEFVGRVSRWCIEEIEDQRIKCIDGEIIGIKTRIGKPILVEEWMEENYLDVDSSKLNGVYIPSEEILRRPKYQWFAILPKEDIMKSRTILAKYFQASQIPISSKTVVAV